MNLRRVRRKLAEYRRRQRREHRFQTRIDRLIVAYLRSKEKEFQQ
jgi:hypothetical protein